MFFKFSHKNYLLLCFYIFVFAILFNISTKNVNLYNKNTIIPFTNFISSNQDVKSTNLSFNCIDELKSTNLKIGSIVSTSGYHFPNDGGAATYLITNNNIPENGSTIIGLKNGKKAEMQITNNTIIAEQCGAYGDGIHDDVTSLQNAFDSGYNVVLTAGKTYKIITNGLYFKNSLQLDGQNATLLISNDYSPSKSDFQNYFLRYCYGKQLSYINLSNINISIDFNNNRYLQKKFVVISPLYIDNVILENVNITTNETNNKIIGIYQDRGCSSFLLKDSKICINTSGEEGGALWIVSKSDEIFGTHNSINNGQIINSYLYSSTADEVLGIYGTNNMSLLISNSSIIGKIRAIGRTRPITVYSLGNNNALFNVIFDNCNISASCFNECESSYYDSVLGIGTNFPSNKINVTFNNCIINSTLSTPLLFPNGYASDSSQIQNFDALNESVKISFNSCQIEHASTITGGNINYFNTSKLYPISAWSCSFSDCHITCKTSFAYLHSPSQNYYVPSISLNNSIIEIKNAKNFICRSYLSAAMHLNLTNCSIITDKNAKFIWINNPNIITRNTQKNACDNIQIINSFHNNMLIQY